MELNSQDSALLVMDMQTGILRLLADPGILISNVPKAISHARENKIPVIYVTVGFRPGAPEISNNNKSFSAGGKQRFTGQNMQEFMKIHPVLSSKENEIIIVKRRVSGFTGSDLEVVLRSMEIRHIILTGYATSGVVLSTTREAADKDFRITIISDACADADEEVHRVLTTKVFPRQAEMMTVDEWTRKK